MRVFNEAVNPQIITTCSFYGTLKLTYSTFTPVTWFFSEVEMNIQVGLDKVNFVFMLILGWSLLSLSVFPSGSGEFLSVLWRFDVFWLCDSSAHSLWVLPSRKINRSEAKDPSENTITSEDECVVSWEQCLFERGILTVANQRKWCHRSIMPCSVWCVSVLPLILIWSVIG